MQEIRFHDLIGQKIIISSGIFNNSGAPIFATLRGVETGGLWVENQEITDLILKTMEKTMLEATPVMFVPFSQIHWAFDALGEHPSLSTDLV